jgi:drug/metabolite transporter (DMT)-like permease
MSSLPIILGLTAALCWGSSDYISRYQSAKVGHYSTVVYTLSTNLVVLFLLYPILRPPTAFPLVPTLLVVGAGALNFFAFIFLYRAIHKGVVSAVAPVAYTYPVVTTILSVLLLGSALTIPEGLAITAVILGVVLLSTRFSELMSYARGGGLPKIAAGVEWAAVAAASFGAVYVVVGYSTASLGYFMPAIIIRGVGGLIGFILAPALHTSVRPSRATFSSIVITIAVLESVGLLAFNYGLSIGPNAIPEVAALSGMGGAVAASYAMVVLKERLELNQLLGAILAVAGVFTLLLLAG